MEVDMSQALAKFSVSEIQPARDALDAEGAYGTENRNILWVLGSNGRPLVHHRPTLHIPNFHTMGGGNIDPFYNTMHSSGSEASSTVASPTLHTSNDGPNSSPTDVDPDEPKYPNVAFTTRAPNGVETKITIAMEKPGVCGGSFSTKLSLDIPRIDVSRITIGPKEQGFILYAADGRQTTLSVSGEVTYDIQLLDSECSAEKGDETVKSAGTHTDTANQENEATPVLPQATSPAPSHATTALDAAELLQSLRSLLATPHVRAPRTRNQASVFDGDVETNQPRDCDGSFIYSQDVHPASRIQGPRRRRSHTLLRRPSQEFLTVPSPEIGLFATPVNVGRGQPVDTRGRPADVRSALRSVLSLSRTGSMASERDVRFEDGDPYADHRETQEYHVDPHTQERTVSFGREERMPSPEPEQYPPIHIHDPWILNTDGHRYRYRVSTPLPGRTDGGFFNTVETPSPPGSPAFESPAAPYIRLQAPTPLVGGQRPLVGGQPSLMTTQQVQMPNVEHVQMPNVEQERRETPLPAGFVPSGPSPIRNASAMQHLKAAARQGQYERAHKHLFKIQQGYLAADNNASAAQPLTTAQRPSTAQTNFFSERYGRIPDQAQSQSDRTTQLLAPTMTGSQYGFATSPYGPSSAPYGLSSAPYGLPSAPNGFPTAPYSNWTPYTGALGQGTPLTPLGITPNFNSVSPGYPLPPMTNMTSMTNLSSMPMLLPVATGTGASPNTQWYTPASCSLLAPPMGAMASSLSTSNPSPNAPGLSNGVYASSPNMLAPPPNVYGAPSPNMYGAASSNSHGPPSPNASVARTTYASSSTAATTTSAPSAPAHLCHAPWLAPQLLAATPTRLVVPSATYASSSATHRSPTETRHDPTSSHRGPPPTPFTAFTSPYAIAMPDQPEPVIPERPSLEPQTPYRSFTPTSSSSPSPTPFARTPFPKLAPPLPPSPEPVEGREDNNNDNSGWASSWVDPHAGWGNGDAYAGWDAWVLGSSAPSDERDGRSMAGGAMANEAQGSTSLYDALFGSPERAHESTTGGHATTDKKVAFARISESDWYPQ
ncbi:hypothetical protein EV121DRAFT_266772 [Schizophyllum commune]